MFYAYILECADGTYYCGYTNDIEKRTAVHNSGKGAKYTRSRLPVKLHYYEEFEDKHSAMSREYQLKQLNHEGKRKLAMKQSTL